MQCNVGKTDRWIRVIIGLVVIAVGFIYRSWWGALGLVPIFTALVKWCPLYVPFRISTCKTE